MACGDLVTQITDRLRWRPDPDEPGVDHRLCEIRVLGEEPVPGVYRVGTAAMGYVDDLGDIQVGLRSGRSCECVGLIGNLDVEGITIRVRVDRHRRQAGVAAGAGYSDSDLATVGDQDLMHAAKSAGCSGAWHPGVVFILASASPARRRLLEQAGVQPSIIVSGVDEEALVTTWGDPPPAEIARRLARAKAETVAALPEARGSLVLACDSVFDLDGEAMGKPGSAEVARARWTLMRGRSGVLHTGHCLIDTESGQRAEELVSTTVTMGGADDDEIDAYIATGEPLQVAGGFTLDGRGAPFIAGIEGDPGNVIGVSLPAVRRLGHALGFTWPALLAISESAQPSARPGVD